MNTIARPLLVVGVLLFARDALAHAQDSRHGTWMEWGLGYGSASFSCDTCTRSTQFGGWTFAFEIGGTPSDQVRLGAELRSWFNGLKRSAPLAGIATGTLSVSYYPRFRGGPFLEGGAGLSYYVLGKGTGDPIEPLSRDTTYYSGTGWGFTFGVGWEVPLGHGDALTPRISYHHGFVSTLHSPDGARVATGWNQNLLSVEVRFLGSL
jgi:hypothetical protein